jgi:hypothetical protein
MDNLAITLAIFNCVMMFFPLYSNSGNRNRAAGNYSSVFYRNFIITIIEL